MVKRRIYKYTFEIGDDVTIRMTAGADVIAVQMQHDTPTLWAIVDPSVPDAEHRFRIFGTGHPVPEFFSAGKHVATFQERGFVWHMFDAGEG